MKIEFETGDLVVLRSGGPLLTVTGIYPQVPHGYILVAWIDEKGVGNSLTAPEECFGIGEGE